MAKLTLTDLAIQKIKPPESGQAAYWDTALKGFGLRVSQGGTKTFVVNHQGTLKTLGRWPELSLKEARRDAKAVQAVSAPPSTGKRTQEAVLAFLEATERNTKPATVYQYRMYLKRWTLDKKLSDLTRKDITDHLKQYDTKPTSQNYAYGTFRTFLNWCVEQEYIDHSPITRMKAPNRLKSRDRVLTDEELRKIWHATDYQPYGHYVRVLMLTGQRKMEIYKLTSFDDNLTFADTKNGTTHTIPVTPLVREHLHPPLNINHWSTQKDRLDKLSGVTGWRLHDLRRSLATNMARLGVNSDIIERVLNHKAKGVRAVYQRWSYLQEMGEALLTHEAFIKTITAPGYQPRVTRDSLIGVRDETAKQESVTREDESQPTTPGTT